MTRDQIRDITNQRLSPILRLARLMAEKDTSTVAQELGAPELDIQYGLRNILRRFRAATFTACYRTTDQMRSTR